MVDALPFGLFQLSFFLLSVLNVSTSIQLSVRVEDTGAEGGLLGGAVEVVPYFQTARLAVVAGLNGGNVLTSFTALLNAWLQELGEL